MLQFSALQERSLTKFSDLTNQLEATRAELESTRQQLVEAESKRKSTSKTDDDDLEDFGDEAEGGNEMLLGEIEDLKQQLQDLEEEREFSKHEWEGILAAEQEKSEKLEKQLAENTNNSQVL